MSRSARRLSWVLSAVSLAALIPVSQAAAQAVGSVRGTVVDSAGRQPIAGVSVSVVGTARGAITDAFGRYVVRGVPAGAATLRAQRIGFAPQTQSVAVTANAEASADFVLRAQAAVLSEIVVIGYGSRSRDEVSSAVANVSGDAIQNVPLAGIDAALQGKAPGVQVIQNAGNPGNGISVRVRGSSSISASNQPLYVIDGMPMIREEQSQFDVGGQDLTAITGLSPDEIESIDVLKDAAAASIYGSRASNGVVMITTKRGRPGASRFSFNTYYGQQKIARKLPLLNSKDYVTIMREAQTNDGYTDDDVLGFYGVMWRPGVDDKIDTDWQSSVLRTAPVADYNLSASGGGDRFQYLLSGSFFDQEGIIVGSKYDRANARLNMDLNATSKLQLKSSIGLVRERFGRTVNDNTVEGAGANAIALQPNLPVYKPGTTAYAGSDEGLAYANPVALARLDDIPSTTFRALGSLEAGYDLTDRIRLNARVGADAYNIHERDWSSPQVSATYSSGAGGTAEQGTSTSTRYLAETFGNYDPIRSGTQKLSITAGASVEYNKSERVYLAGEGFASEATQYVGSAAKVTTFDSYPEEHNLLSLFSRANYALLDRYFMTASLRGDGSSRFAKKTRWGVFPSASFGWTLSEEPMFSDVKRFMSAKLRVSYGETGNQALSTNTGYLTTFGKAAYAGEIGLASSTQLGNPSLKWETTREFDVGADLGFLNGRVGIIADWYQKKTKDLLVSRNVPAASGFLTILDNVGSVENRGWELQLTTVNVEGQGTNSFRWSTDFNISHNKNEITELYKNEPFVSGIRSVNRVQVGQPIGAFYTLKFIGVDEQTGQAKFDDLNKDGSITAADRQIVGSPHPDYYGGLRNQLSWKGFDVNSFFEFSRGAEVFNLIRLFADDGGCFTDNKFANILNRWQKPGDKTNVPRMSLDCASDANDASSRFVEDASYVRLAEITLGYRLPRSIASATRLSDARVYVSGRNLKLWTDYMGYDPDVNSNGSSANTSLGQDFYAYPRAKTITFGISGSW